MLRVFKEIGKLFRDPTQAMIEDHPDEAYEWFLSETRVFCVADKETALEYEKAANEKPGTIRRVIAFEVPKLGYKKVFIYGKIGEVSGTYWMAESLARFQKSLKKDS